MWQSRQNLQSSLVSRPFTDLQSCALTTRPQRHQWMRQFHYTSHNWAQFSALTDVRQLCYIAHVLLRTLWSRPHCNQLCETTPISEIPRTWYMYLVKQACHVTNVLCEIGPTVLCSVKKRKCSLRNGTLQKWGDCNVLCNMYPFLCSLWKKPLCEMHLSLCFVKQAPHSDLLCETDPTQWCALWNRPHTMKCFVKQGPHNDVLCETGPTQWCALYVWGVNEGFEQYYSDSFNWLPSNRNMSQAISMLNATFCYSHRDRTRKNNLLLIPLKK